MMMMSQNSEHNLTSSFVNKMEDDDEDNGIVNDEASDSEYDDKTEIISNQADVGKQSKSRQSVENVCGSDLHNGNGQAGYDSLATSHIDSLNKDGHSVQAAVGSDLQPNTSLDSTYQYFTDSQFSVKSLSASADSFSSTASGMVQISTKEARKRGFLVGSICSGQSMLGASELQRCFPERRMRIFFGTWNMGGMRDVPASLDNFLLPELIEYIQDVYVIGTQEAISNRSDWELKLQETLGPQHVLYHSASHGTLHVAVFLRRDLIWFCSVSEEATVTTRPGPSSIKTKGALGICFRLFGTSFLFINSHFAAHDDRANERIEDYKKIAAGLDLPKVISKKSGDDVTSRFDYVFWMGDLNSRIQKDRNQVDKLIEGSENANAGVSGYDDVVKHDELKMAVDAGLTFLNFQEGRIKFRPTYKYNIGTNDFDTSRKMRTPSYTDRILFRCRKKNTLACLYYDAVLSMCESDHKPVVGLYEVFLRPGVDTSMLRSLQPVTSLIRWQRRLQEAAETSDISRTDFWSGTIATLAEDSLATQT